jgi:hypothetical protein
MKTDERKDFRLYLRQCSDAQVVGVYEKERAAAREDEVDLAEQEAERRGITLD